MDVAGKAAVGADQPSTEGTLAGPPSQASAPAPTPTPAGPTKEPTTLELLGLQAKAATMTDAEFKKAVEAAALEVAAKSGASFNEQNAKFQALVSVATTERDVLKMGGAVK